MSGSVGGLPSKVYRLAASLGEGLLAVRVLNHVPSSDQTPMPLGFKRNALSQNMPGMKGESEGGKEE